MAVLPYEVDASAYLDDEGLIMAEEGLDEGTMNEVGGCHHTSLYRDLRVRHNEVVGEDKNNLVGGHDAEGAHKKNRNA